MAGPSNVDAGPSSSSSVPSLPPSSSSQSPRPPVPVVSHVTTCEEMNPSRRCSMEDCSVYAEAGTWGAPDPGMALLCICDGHGGREMVEYLEEGLVYHVAQELQHSAAEGAAATSAAAAATAAGDGDDAGPSSAPTLKPSMGTTLERAFMMADVHSKTLGVNASGATVALCLVQRLGRLAWTVHAANAGDARIVLGHNHGEAFRLTKDHRTDDPEEVRRIESTGGFMFKGRVLGVLAVTRSLGDHWYAPCLWLTCLKRDGGVCLCL
jgi:protein phosphatase